MRNFRGYGGGGGTENKTYHQSASCPGICGLSENLNKRKAGWCCQGIIKITQTKQYCNQHANAQSAIHKDRSNHAARDNICRIFDFLSF